MRIFRRLRSRRFSRIRLPTSGVPIFVVPKEGGGRALFIETPSIVTISSAKGDITTALTSIFRLPVADQERAESCDSRGMKKKSKRRRDDPRGPSRESSRSSRRYLGQGGLTAQKSGLERARRIDGVLPGKGHVRRCRGTLAEPWQGDLSARLLGDRRRFPGR